MYHARWININTQHNLLTKAISLPPYFDVNRLYFKFMQHYELIKNSSKKYQFFAFFLLFFNSFTDTCTGVFLYTLNNIFHLVLFISSLSFFHPYILGNNLFSNIDNQL